MAGQPAVSRRLIFRARTGQGSADGDSAHPRVFLVVVDETEELQIAVHYAARRAAHTGGRVAMLYVIEPSELQHWMAIENLAREERREEAEQLMQRLCEEISPIAGSMPIVYIREGRTPRRAAGADQRGAEHLDPGAGGRHRPRGTGAADLLSYRQACGALAHPDHDRSRRPDDGTARRGQLSGA